MTRAIELARAVKWAVLPAAARIRARVPVGHLEGAMTFIVGCGRSGTTIFGRIADLHPGVKFLNEPIHYWFAVDPRTDSTAFFREGGRCWLDATDFSEPAASRLSRLFGQVQRGKVLIEKMPINSLRMEWLDAICPDARFVHLIRDGRAVVESIARIHREGDYRVAGKDYHQWWGRDRKKWKSLAREGAMRGFYPEALVAIGGEQARDPHAMGAYEWLVSVRQVRESAAKMALGPDRLFECRYEELLENTESVLASLARFLEASGHEEFLASAKSRLERPRPIRLNCVWPRPLYEAFVEMQLRLGYAIEGIRAV